MVTIENFKEQREGEVNTSNEGYELKIIKYENRRNVYVEIQDKYKTIVKVQYIQFKKGEIKNPYHPNKFGGYIGVGKFESSISNKKTKAYQTWIDMLKRCYDERYKEKEPTYKDCHVCNEWLNFQNFAEWFYNNYYEIEEQRMHLDKDVLYKNNKIYSPKTCIFVPQRINSLFIKCKKTRGKYPIGIAEKYENDNICLYVDCSIFDGDKRKSKYIGRFPLDKPFQAFTAYKKFKENYIKEVADEYKELIPQKLYEAMYNYEVEIND